MLAAALFAAAGFAGAAVCAPQAPHEVRVAVSSNGLDLTTDAGAGRFLERLDAAVTRACDDRPTDGPAFNLSRSADFYLCRRQTLETVMAQVRAPAVKRLYAAMAAEDSVRLAHR